MDQLVIHFSFDGNIIEKDSEEARDQEEVWMQKNENNKALLDKINQGVKEIGEEPEGDEGEGPQGALRNQFNF